MPPQLIIFIIAMSPVVELRGAIPVALSVYQLSPLNAYLWSVLGNLVPAVVLLWLLEPVSRYLSRRFYFFSRFFGWLFERTRRNHNHKFAIWGSLALIGFVAIPLPMTGVWTGSVAAFVFGIPFKKALPLISIGVIIAGIVVTLFSMGILNSS